MSADFGTPKSFVTSDSGVMTLSSDGLFLSSDFHDSTPVSPSSAFSMSSLSGIDHSFVDAILLCQWDNILGPRLEHVWYIRGRPEPHTNILRFSTTQVLSGEICRDVNSSQVDFKFFDIPEKGIIIPSFIFSAKGTSGLSLHALALIIPNSELTLYLSQADLVHTWFMRIVGKLRVICAKKDFSTSGLADLSSWLVTCMEMLSSLQEVGLPLRIELNYTAFSPSYIIESDFLRQVIASHLMTFSRSIVFGETVDKVNVLVYTLGLFCWDNERLCSRPALSHRNWPYFPELFVQGCMKDARGSANFSSKDFLFSRYPTTIVDIERREVIQSSSAVDHRRLNHETLVEELEELYHGNHGFSTGALNTFQTANIPESFVKNVIDGIHKLPAQNGIREAYIKHFLFSLQRRAVCLIKHIESESPSVGGSTTASHNPRINTKRLRQDMGLQLEGDFRIVLATADKLKPGFYNYVLGDRKYDSEYLPNMADVL